MTVTLKDSTGYIYVNGILDASGPFHIPSHSLRVDNYVGRSNWPVSDADVSAAISNIKIFNRTMNEREMISNFYLYKKIL